jgi:HAD superfamily hydrolase (TIGR01450 family)
MATRFEVKGLLLDLEGTLVGDKRYWPIPGVPQWFQRVRQEFVTGLQTNNTTETPETIQGMLARAGIALEPSRVISPLTVLAARVAERPGLAMLVLGAEIIEEVVKSAGGVIVGEDQADVVVVGLHLSLTYEGLKRALTPLCRRRAELWALHYNRLYQDVDGRLGPSVGALARCLEFASGTRALVLGKPAEAFFALAEARLDLSPSEILFVSDDPFSDLTAAKRRGMKTVFVLCGKYKDRRVIEEIDPSLRPDLVVPSPASLDETLLSPAR